MCSLQAGAVANVHMQLQRASAQPYSVGGLDQSFTPTFLSRLCFWMAHGTIWQVPAPAKKKAASVCVPAAKHSQAPISAV